MPYMPVSARLAGTAMLALGLAACSSRPPQAEAPPATTHVRPSQSGDAFQATSVTIRALGLVGTPYRYGGNTPDSGFDCSGLVTYVFADMLDLRLPRTSRELARVQGPKIAPERLSSGDLVFFGSGADVWHVGIYVGEGRFVHAPSTGGTVRLDALDNPYWQRHYSGAKRVL
jgi:cell wall-associated NlpC family hydrolase